MSDQQAAAGNEEVIQSLDQVFMEQGVQVKPAGYRHWWKQKKKTPNTVCIFSTVVLLDQYMETLNITSCSRLTSLTHKDWYIVSQVILPEFNALNH